MHLIVASNQATTLESSTQKPRANRTGGRTNCVRNLAKTRPLLSQPRHLVAIDNSPRPSQRLPFELRIAQSGTDTFLNQRSLKFCHRTNDLKHQPPRRGGQVQVVTKADKGHAVGVKISERVDEVLQRPPEAVNFPAKHYIKVPPVSVGHEAIEFRNPAASKPAPFFQKRMLSCSPSRKMSAPNE